MQRAKSRTVRYVKNHAARLLSLSAVGAATPPGKSDGVSLEKAWRRTTRCQSDPSSRRGRDLTTTRASQCRRGEGPPQAGLARRTKGEQVEGFPL
ncbi:hypothetical protein BKA80DRAFT_295588, partial [Phyllosticta citrichinensis]